ncbi:MAG: hypothetical protein HGB37_00915 [Candidatus Moranbacteria bacterium]|jgi:hypothetical protein|nr:hypothetical protein [Candidatus Moranbacteria bacterium]NTW89459.1 hypothetical protein [Candidatus Moranbacteria bacterium]
METLSLIVDSILFVSLLLSIVFTAGVVWRVEMRLDVSYKFYLAAIVCFLLAEIFDLWYVPETREIAILASHALRTLFSVLFLAGILSMRRIVRDMDGERRKKGRK